MPLAPETFQFVKSRDEHGNAMSKARELLTKLAADLDPLIPEGPDKTFIMRTLRTAGMWVNTAITRHPDGTPR